MESSQSRTTTRSSQYVPVASQTSWTFGTFGKQPGGREGRRARAREGALHVEVHSRPRLAHSER